jgi:hypothetical protein
MRNLPQLAKFFQTFLRVSLDLLSVFRTGLRSRSALAAENLFLAEATGLVSGTEEETQASDRCGSLHYGAARQVLGGLDHEYELENIAA